MTNQEINIAIAEACGWKDIRPADKLVTVPMGSNPDPDEGYEAIPSYTTDLNAMHEAVVAFKQTVNDPDRRWSNELMRVIQDHECCGAIEARYRTANATALQRAEAFLRTLGKWKE